MNRFAISRLLKGNKKKPIAFTALLFLLFIAILWNYNRIGDNNKIPYRENMSGQLPLKDTIKNTLINHSRKFPNEKIFAVCVTRLNNIEITLNVVSQPARQSSVFDYPTYYYLYDSAKQVLFLFYSGMEYIVQEKDINDIYSKIIEELSLFDDWNEKTGQEVNIGTYHEIGFQVNYTLNGNIFIEAGDPFSSCVYFPMVIKEFPIPVP